VVESVMPHFYVEKQVLTPQSERGTNRSCF
jgi:hypothetical protein